MCACARLCVVFVVFAVGCLGWRVVSSQWPDDSSSDISHAPHVTSAHPPRLPYPPIHSALFPLLPYRLLSPSRPLVCHAEDCCNVAISLSLRRFDYLRLLLRTLRSLTVSAACSDRSTTTQLLSAQLLRGQRLTAFAVHIHPCRTHSPLLPVCSESQPRVGPHSLCVLRGCAIAKNTSNHHYLPQPTAANVSFHLSLPPLSLPSDWPTKCVSSKDPEKTTEKKTRKIHESRKKSPKNSNAPPSLTKRFKISPPHADRAPQQCVSWVMPCMALFDCQCRCGRRSSGHC